MVNGPEHESAQEFFKQLLSIYEYECKLDYYYETGVKRAKGQRKASEYYFDVYAEKATVAGWFFISEHIALPIWDIYDIIVIEVDGKDGHSSKRSYTNREFKKEFCNQKGFRFFAFPTKWIVGENKLDVETFLEEIKPI